MKGAGARDLGAMSGGERICISLSFRTNVLLYVRAMTYASRSASPTIKIKLFCFPSCLVLCESLVTPAPFVHTDTGGKKKESPYL